MQRLIIVTVLISFLLVGCSPKEEKRENYFIIKGKLKNAANIRFGIDELTPKDLVPVDSIFTDNEGKFAYRSLNIEDAGFYILRINRINSLTLLIEPGEVVSLTGDANNILKTAEIDGSAGSNLMLKLNRKLAQSYNVLDSLADLYRESRYLPEFDNIRQTLNAEYVRIYEGQKNFVQKFIKNNPESLASIIALNQYLGARMLLTMSENFELFESLSNSLSAIYPTNKHVIDLKRQISNFKRRSFQRQQAEEQLALGKKAPEILMNNNFGTPTALSSLSGKFVLIDFWANWCDLCLENNEKLKHIHSLYKKQGFEIYAVSLDRSINEWQQGIDKLKANWIHVSDLQFWNSPVIGLYNIDGLPFNVLIDREGIIIGKNLAPEELEEILSKKLK
ncbi:MAG: TlpA family protein disulfide reductase [Bacteroidetes bacterium]|nr:TlpA family protein disulfide reductase [Bacteroidota bacterium]